VVRLDHPVHLVGLAEQAAAAGVFGAFSFVVHGGVRVGQFESDSINNFQGSRAERHSGEWRSQEREEAASAGADIKDQRYI
jgi:hypothetical protein